jgi:hypothetical protein
MYMAAISGSIRRATRKPSVTAGFRCPEILMVAVTIMEGLPVRGGDEQGGEADLFPAPS